MNQKHIWIITDSGNKRKPRKRCMRCHVVRRYSEVFEKYCYYLASGHYVRKAPSCTPLDTRKEASQGETKSVPQG